MDKAESWSLIARHLSGSTTPEEDQSLMSWSQSNPENKKTFDEATRIWNVTGKYNTLPEIEIQEEWQTFLQKIETERNKPNDNVGGLWQSLGDTIKVAAGILLLAVVAWVLRPKDVKPEIAKETVAQEPVLAVFSTAEAI